MSREDVGDVIYKTTRAKITAIVNEVEEAHKKHQPVLVGTTSIDKNELIAELLKRKKIPHEVLNAKNHEREALIIKDAGRLGAVTVATNMAGRGVDIILGGQSPSQFELQYQGEVGKKRYEKEYAEWKKEHDRVKSAGGLYVIGTEKHESRRIDNQLRGRSGRQGDPGKSIFIISLEDDLMRVFGGEQISNLMTRFNFPEDQPLAHGLVSRVIEQAQVKVEGFNFEIRKNLLDYDDVLNKQREIVYEARRGIVGNTGISEFVLGKIKQVIESRVEFSLSNPEGEDRQFLVDSFSDIIPFDEESKKQLYNQVEQVSGKDALVEFLFGVASQVYKRREEDSGKEANEYVAKIVSLTTIDNLWMDHLTAMEDLRTGIGLRGYGQRDPLIEYKNEAFEMFDRLMQGIDDGIVNRIYKVHIEHQHAPTPVPEIPKEKMILNQPEIEVSEEARRKSQVTSHKENNSKKKLGRNDPCHCGSGKKWKKCHYPN